MFSFEKSIGAVLFRVENKKPLFLLLHYRSGHWEFPKGHQEKGETDEETLRREVQEETGIKKLRIFPGFKKRVRYFYQAKGQERKKRIEKGRGIKIFKRVIYYLAQTDTQEVKISSFHEHVGFEWLTHKDALQRVSSENAKKVIKFFYPRIRAELEKSSNKE